MMEMVIDSIRVSLMNYQRVVILRVKDTNRYLPIWIGPSEAESIALKDALRGYTIGPAFACHMESEVGVIKPGTLADLILLDRDIISVPPEELTETQVTHTIIGGSPVWNLEDN